VDSKLKRQSSSVWVDLFVAHGCTSRLDWQLAASPTSIDESGMDYLYRVDMKRSVRTLRHPAFRSKWRFDWAQSLPYLDARQRQATH
jgi:hypothetical protein